MTEADRFDLERFVTAQAPVFETVLDELRAGRKRTHWMWFVFPQLAGLGRSSTARFYGISSIDEARAYLAHPVLGPRLDLCTRIVLASESSSLHAIFGSPDDLKFWSCMTLFSLAADGPDNPFRQALGRWCAGKPDDQTLALINTGGERIGRLKERTMDDKKPKPRPIAEEAVDNRLGTASADPPS